MKAKEKIFNLSIEYRDLNGLIKSLENVKKSISPPVKTNYERKMINGCFVEWSVANTQLEDYEVKEIDGKRSIIFQSKMNK